MSRSARVLVAVRLEGSGGAVPGVVGVVDVRSPGGGLPDAQLGRNFLFFWGGIRYQFCGNWRRKKRQGISINRTHLDIFPDSSTDMIKKKFLKI